MDLPHFVNSFCITWWACDVESLILGGFPDSSVGKESTCNAGDSSSSPGSGRSDGEGTIPVFLGFPCGSAGKESACNAGDLSSIPVLERSAEEGKGYPFQYSGLENSMDCIVQGVTKSQARLSDFHWFLKLKGSPVIIYSNALLLCTWNWSSRGTPRPLSGYLLFLIILDARLIQYDVSIHSFFYSFVHMVNK